MTKVRKVDEEELAIKMLTRDPVFMGGLVRAIIMAEGFLKEAKARKERESREAAQGVLSIK